MTLFILILTLTIIIESLIAALFEIVPNLILEPDLHCQGFFCSKIDYQSNSDLVLSFVPLFFLFEKRPYSTRAPSSGTPGAAGIEPVKIYPNADLDKHRVYKESAGKAGGILLSESYHR